MGYEAGGDRLRAYDRGMFRAHVPRAPLGAFVERFWLCTDARARRERILPSGTIELVINLAEDAVRVDERRYSGAVFSGTYARAMVIDAAQHADMLGVHFRPGGAFPLLGIPAGELADAHVDLAALWGPAARALRDRLGEATPAERFRILEDALLARLRRTPHTAVPEALEAFARSRGAASIREVARRTGLSQRRFIDVFRDAVGLTPKVYCRVLRFQHARTLAGRDWGEVALAARYADQAHLIRDFREFASMTPAEYARRASDDCLRNHVPV